MSNIRTEFTPPGPADFDLPPVGGGSTFEFMGQEMVLGVTKPMLQLVLAAVLVFGFFYIAARKREMVPGKLQFVGEEAYSFVRNSMGRDIIGSHDFMRFTPYLFALFFFILLNNLFASIPFLQFPTFSRSGMVYGLAAMSWVIYNAVGMKKHGVLGYLKLQSVPSGVGGPILLLLIPLEFLSNIIVRPVTLALRLFANMLAGHLLLMLFALGGATPRHTSRFQHTNLIGHGECLTGVLFHQQQGHAFATELLKCSVAIFNHPRHESEREFIEQQ